MKTLRKHSFFALVSLVAATTCCAQTAEEIVAKNLDAIGGKDLIANTKSIVMTSNLELPSMGINVPTTTTIVAGKGFKSETDFQGTKIITAVTDHGGWSVNPPVGITTPTAMSDADLKTAKHQLDITPFANYTAAGGKVALLGKDTADYKIKLTNDDGFNATYYVNMKTYLIDRADVHISMQGQDVDASVAFSDYRKIDNGLLVPFKIQREMPQYTLNITTQKVEVNKEIDPSIFEMPK
jgi:outer membrane lipoprotein-sorting protein